MTSPAQRHMMRVSAAMTAQREAAPLRHATVYEQMLVKLAADQRTPVSYTHLAVYKRQIMYISFLSACFSIQKPEIPRFFKWVFIESIVESMLDILSRNAFIVRLFSFPCCSILFLSLIHIFNSI